MIWVRSPERTRRTTYLTIRVARIIIITRDKAGHDRTGTIYSCFGCLYRRSTVLYYYSLTCLRTSYIRIHLRNPSCGSSRGGCCSCPLVGVPYFAPTSIVFLIGGEDRVSFAVEDTVASKLRVDLVAVRQGGTGDVIQYIDRITGDGVGPRRTIAFTGAIRRDIDDRTADRQVGIFERTYIRFATVVTAGIIRHIEIFCFRTRYIIGAVCRDRSGVDAGVVIQRNERYLTAVQRSVALYRVTDITRRVDENRVCRGTTVSTREDTLVIFLRRHW